MAADRPRVLYFSYAPDDMLDIVRRAMPDGVELRTLGRDTDEERLAKIADCAAVIVAAAPLGRRFIDAAPGLRLVLHQGVGYHDTVDTAALAERGIALALTPDSGTEGVAEHAILLMLAACKRLPFVDAELRRGRWHVNTLRARSRQLADCLVGYVGMGRIAQAVAARLKAFGCAGVYFDPVALDLAAERALGVARGTFDEVLTTADIVTLHLPLTARTRHLIDAGAMARMKPGAILVNTARGGLVDERALCAALDDGRIAAAGLDVFEHEPPPPDHPLLRHENVVLTPHIATATRDALTRKMRAIGENLARWFAGEPLRNGVDLGLTLRKDDAPANQTVSGIADIGSGKRNN